MLARRHADVMARVPARLPQRLSDRGRFLLRYRPAQTQTRTPHKITHDDAVERADEKHIDPTKAIVAMNDGGEDHLLPPIGKCLSEQDRGLEIQMNIDFANDDLS
jgi:hypothetical protein